MDGADFAFFRWHCLQFPEIHFCPYYVMPGTRPFCHDEWNQLQEGAGAQRTREGV